jgi:hypothetical protein
VTASCRRSRTNVGRVADPFIDGRRMRILVVVDDCTRECLALVADTSISGIRVARRNARRVAAFAGAERDFSSTTTIARNKPHGKGPCQRCTGQTSAKASSRGQA